MNQQNLVFGFSRQNGTNQQENFGINKNWTRWFEIKDSRIKFRKRNSNMNNNQIEQKYRIVVGCCSL